jgi:hypothetical protein
VSPSNARRDLRRAASKRDRLANEIAEAVSAGVDPNPDSVARWQYFSMRVYALERNLRPRECGTPLGEGSQPAAPLRGVSRPVDRDAGRGPESGTSSNPNTQTQPTP